MLRFGKKWSIPERHCEEVTNLLEENDVKQVCGDIWVQGYVYYWISDNGGEISISVVNDNEKHVDVQYQQYPRYSPMAMCVGILKGLKAIEDNEHHKITWIIDWLDWVEKYNEYERITQ